MRKSTKVEMLDKRLRSKGVFVSFYEATMRFEDGTTAEWDYLHHNGAAGVLAVDADGCVLMIRQYRPGADEEILELPAGGINEGEAPEECARRELREETGALCEELQPLLTILSSPAYNDEKVTLFHTKVTTYTDRQLDNNEYVTIERYPLKMLIQMILSGKITDAKTVAGILAYQSKNSDGNTSATREVFES